MKKWALLRNGKKCFPSPDKWLSNSVDSCGFHYPSFSFDPPTRLIWPSHITIELSLGRVVVVSISSMQHEACYTKPWSTPNKTHIIFTRYLQKVFGECQAVRKQCAFCLVPQFSGTMPIWIQMSRRKERSQNLPLDLQIKWSFKQTTEKWDCYKWRCLFSTKGIQNTPALTKGNMMKNLLKNGGLKGPYFLRQAMRYPLFTVFETSQTLH